MTRKILAVGDMVADILLPPLADLPAVDTQLTLDMIELSPGGNTLNFALSAAAQGAPVEFFGAHGGDALVAMLREWMDRLGVDDRSRTLVNTGTAKTVAIPGPDGSRRLLTYPGANALFRIDADRLPLKNAAHLHIGGYWFLGSMMGRPALELLRRCNEMGIETSFDPATNPSGWGGREVEQFRELIPFIDILFVNDSELKGISGVRFTDDAAEKLLSLGTRGILLHRGSDGASFFDRQGARSDFPAYRVERPLNPTGCGDILNGAFIASRLRGDGLELSINYGMAAASLHLGSAIPLYPDRTMTERLIKCKNR